MRDSSEMFTPSLAGSHQVSAEVDAFYNGTPVITHVPISDGSLEVDGSQLIPASLSVTIPRFFTGPDGVRRDLLPTTDLDAFNCNGQQVTVSYTISRPGHGTETIPMGWYRINGWTEEGANLNVSATGLEVRLDEARFLAPLQLRPGTTRRDAIQTMVDRLLPLRFAPPVTGTLGGRTAEDNRLEALAQMLSDWGYRMSVDDQGILAIDQGWDDYTDPAVAFLTDGEDGTVVRSPTAGDRDRIYNAVVASGEQDGDVAPVSAAEFLRDGPRAWNGPYGNVPYFMASPLLTTVAQCRSAAATRLRNLQAIANPVTIEAVPDPRYQIGDVLHLTYRGQVRLVRVDSIKLPLTASGGPMVLGGHEISRPA